LQPDVEYFSATGNKKELCPRSAASIAVASPTPLDAPVIAITFTRIEDQPDNPEDKTHG